MRIDSSGNDAWLRKKMLERQAENGIQAQVPQNIQPNEQTNGTNKVQNTNRVVEVVQPQVPQQDLQRINPQGSDKADISAIGEKPTQMSAQAADSSSKLQDEEKSAAANAQIGATQISDIRRYEIEQKKANRV